MRSILKTASIWGLVGLGTPLSLMLGGSLLGLLRSSALFSALDGLRQDVELFVWPTSFWLMATEGAGRATTIEIEVVAILANFAVYFMAGLILTAAWRGLKHLVARPNSNSPARAAE